jgi:urease accessory protein
MSLINSHITALQQADSFFPGGTVPWSWGLETLKAEGRLKAALIRGRAGREMRSRQMLEFIVGQLRLRWATFERVFLEEAWRIWLNGCDIEERLAALAVLDRKMEAMTPIANLRHGSRKNGQALLNVHAELCTPGADIYKRLADEEIVPGHLAVVQGLLWSSLGMDICDALLTSLHLFCTGLTSASLRLGLLTHIDAQLVLRDLRPYFIEALKKKPCEPVLAYSFAPVAEIAAMRHNKIPLRLFAN